MRCHHHAVKQCALRASSMHDVHHAIVGVNVVINVLVVHCELLVVRVVPLVVCDDAVVRRTLVLIDVADAFVFVVAIFHRILLYWRYIVHTNTSSAHRPYDSGHLADLAISVLRKLRVDTVLTRTQIHFCSRLQWYFMRRTRNVTKTNL